MNCEAVREWLREADPEALAQVEASPVAEHLQSCPSCRAMVSRLLTMQQEVQAAYLAAAPGRSAADVAGQVLASGPNILPIRSGRRNIIAAAGMLGLAAAAVLVVAVVGRGRVAPAAPVVAPAVVADSAPAATIAVEVPEGRNAIVFATRNPLISVVWIY